MNYSARFRSGVLDFVTLIGHNMPDMTISDIDRNCVFCYMKNTPIYKVSVIDNSGDVVVPIKISSRAPETISKAEDILHVRTGIHGGLNPVILNGEIYYVCNGLIFNKDKSPIVVACSPKTSVIQRFPVLCFDYSVLENPDEPLNRFIMRKFIPYIVYQRDRGSSVVRYAVMNCRSFIVKPTFQGELDHHLVSVYLANRIFNEFKDEQSLKDPKQF